MISLIRFNRSICFRRVKTEKCYSINNFNYKEQIYNVIMIVALRQSQILNVKSIFSKINFHLRNYIFNIFIVNL